MSKSRSPTPTPTLFPTSNPLSLDLQTTSRPHTDDKTPPHFFGERQSPTTLAPQPEAYTPLASTSQAIPTGTASRSSRRKRPRAEATAASSKTKKMRRDLSEERTGQTSRSSPSGSSQGGLADNETEGERSQQSEISATVAPPPKKKRTRTLTTPHQSAVLHALLTQSRFPTTAMREEVGRSIGLSARKVQIWFQNQRQKARRPRSQSDAPLTRPPQFGPFPNTLDAQMSSSSRREHAHNVYPQIGSEQRTMELLGSGSHLLGPGMPGSVPVTRAAFLPRRSSLQQPHSGQFPPSFSEAYPRRSASPPRLEQAFSQLHRPHTGGYIERDFSRTLPPLPFDVQPSRSSFVQGSSSSRSLAQPTLIPESHRGQISPLSESPFAHHFSESSSRGPLFPPPGPIHRETPGYPSRTSWPGPPSSYRDPHESSTLPHGRLLPAGAPAAQRRHSLFDREYSMAEPSAPTVNVSPPQHRRRYDPVRDAQAEHDALSASGFYPRESDNQSTTPPQE